MTFCMNYLKCGIVSVITFYIERAKTELNWETYLKSYCDFFVGISFLQLLTLSTSIYMLKSNLKINSTLNEIYIKG